MEVIAPLARSPDFHFNTTTFSPYRKTPSSPFAASFGCKYDNTSAPASPARLYLSPESTTTTRVQRLRVRGRSSFAPNPPRNGPSKSRSISPTRNEGFFAKNNGSPPAKCCLGRKWPKLKDLLLFRSASEGRVSGKYEQQKYTILASDSPANKTVVRRRRRSQPAVSPHERHYTANRAAAEENRRKTPLPFQRTSLISFIDISPPIWGKNKVAGLGGASSFSKGIF